MKKFTATVHYTTKTGRRQTKTFVDISATSISDAKAYARVRFHEERAVGKNAKNYAEAQPRITRVSAAEADVAVAVAPPKKIDLSPVGKVVRKTSGDYEFEGVIVGVVTKLSGAQRYVVEDSRGLLLIMNAKQVGL